MGAAAKSADPLLGVVLADTYRIDRQLAEGGMSLLYEAFHLRLEMMVAVKTVHHASGGRPDSIERSRREARAMAGLVSPNVVRIFDVVPAPDGRPCIVTELLSGEDLATRLAREKKLEITEAVRIARATAQGLAEAHRRGVLHRDIKPANIFLTSDGGVKLIDFGIAKLEDTGALTHAGTFLGTPAYMSPEQASSASTVDERSDVYGIGAVLYHMLSGRAPFGDLDAAQTLLRRLAGDPPRLTTLDGTLPEGLAALVEKAMSAARADRYASAVELARALDHFEQGNVDEGAERDARWARPSAVVAVLATAILSALWSAAVCAEIASLAHASERWPEWALVLYRALPAVVLTAGLLSGVRSLAARWRSAPRVIALLVGLRRTVWISAAVVGVGATARIAVELYAIDLGVTETEAATVTLLGAVLLASTVAAIGARLARYPRGAASVAKSRG